MIAEALSFVDPTDRDTWVRMGMAVKSELGEAGFDVWDAWSAQADNYKPGSAKAVWRSINEGGGITVGTLYAEAKRNGWTGSAVPLPTTPSPPRRDPQEVRRRALAAVKAEDIIARAKLQVHPYLARKGHAWIQALVLDELLLVPMRNIQTNALQSIQTIDARGNKRFLRDGRARGGVFALGAGSEMYLVEGYATGLSVKAALDSAYRQARVIVCFSAGNIPVIADQIRDKRHAYVVADHDPKSSAGQKAAERAGLPWWMPPMPGDPNDFHLTEGLPALVEALARLSISAFRPMSFDA